MRRRLARTAAAVTGMVVLAFCLPLALVVRMVAHDRAVHAAELESRSLAAVLTGTRDPAVLTPIVGEANIGSPRPATVFLPDGTIVGDQTPGGSALERAMTGQAFTTSAHGGEAVFVPAEAAGFGSPANVGAATAATSQQNDSNFQDRIRRGVVMANTRGGGMADAAVGCRRATARATSAAASASPNAKAAACTRRSRRLPNFRIGIFTYLG